MREPSGCVSQVLWEYLGQIEVQIIPNEGYPILRQHIIRKLSRDRSADKFLKSSFKNAATAKMPKLLNALNLWSLQTFQKYKKFNQSTLYIGKCKKATIKSLKGLKDTKMTNNTFFGEQKSWERL